MNGSDSKEDSSSLLKKSPTERVEPQRDELLGITPLLFALGARPRYGDTFSCHNGPIDVCEIKSLVEQNPQSVRKSWFGHLPLHWACINNAPTEVVRILLESFPDSSKVPGDLHNLPLHLACYNGSSFDVIKLLLESYNEAANIKGEYGRHALHFACLNGASHDVINVLCEANINAASEKGDLGYLPLHLACKNRAGIDVVRRLLVAYPEGAKERDDSGRTPSFYLDPSSPSLSLFII